MRALLLTGFLAAAGLFAAEHKGVVKFGGLPVPGATVVASQGERKSVAVTGLDGGYSFPDLADGVWTIGVDMLCFAPVRQDVTVAPGAPRSEWDLKLLPFDEIKASAPAPPPAPALAVQAPVLTTENKPPARGRKGAKGAAPAANAQSGFQRADVTASAGAAPASDSGGGPPPPGDANQTSTDSFAINGSSNNGAASPFGMSGAFGNNRRGPGSLYNGNVGFVMGNSALDARNYSLTGQDTPKPAYNHLQFMGAVGGPLRIPHVFTGNSVPTFFVAYQLVRNRNASTVSALVPTQEQRDGIVGGAVIPQSLISPQAKALLKFYPLPNFDSSARYNYQTALTGTTSQDNLQTRISKNVGRSNQMFGTFAYQNTRGETTNLFGFIDSTDSAGIDATLNWSHRFSQRLFTTYKFQFNRLATRTTPYFANRTNVSGEAGITGNNQESLNWGPPALTFASGIYPLSDTQQSFNRSHTMAGSVSAYFSHSPHNFTFGGDYKKQQFNYLGQQDARGDFTFTGAAAGSDFADFLLGTPDTSSIAFGNADKYFRSSVYDAYITDDWRISPSFTLNGGVRWEYTAPITEKYGRLVNLDIAPGFTAAAPVVANSPTGSVTGRHYPDSLVQPDKHALQPRVGIAWRPISGSSLVVRAGYGVTYNTSVYQSIAIQMAQQSPLSKSLSVQNTAANPLTLANGFNASPATTQNTFAIDPAFRIGYAQTWQLQVQRDLPGSLVMTATYLGIKGTRAQQAFLPNTYPTAGPIVPCPACQAGYVYMTSNGNSTREAGQFQLRRRLHNGITATAQYVYSKAIDDAALGGRGQNGSLIAQNWLDLSAERGLSNFDQRHALTLQAQYSTGVGVRGGTLMSGWRAAAFKEWTFATLINAGTGTPLSPVYIAAVNGTGVTGSVRPDYTGAPLYSPPPGLSLNPAAYRQPAPGQWGNAGRNSITGPSQFNLGASMARTFPLRDRINMDVRIDAQNALNHVTFTSWNTTFNNAQFGLPVQANPMRTVQATVRVRF
ncbi:MAG: TonB-dependent receptor [Acidobacteriota bacterium]